MTKIDMKHKLKMWQVIVMLGLDNTTWWFTTEESILHAKITGGDRIMAIAGRHTWIKYI